MMTTAHDPRPGDITVPPISMLSAATQPSCEEILVSARLDREGRELVLAESWLADRGAGSG
jgi:hypothetical protein